MTPKCGDCRYYDLDRSMCTRDGSGYSGWQRMRAAPACAAYRETFQSSLRREADERRQQIAEREAEQTNALTLAQNVDRLGQYLAQMGQMMAAMQRRLDEMEARQEKITVSHAEVKRLLALIRARADEICRKYELVDKESPKLFRAAIKKDLLKRYQVKDLHDLPAASLGGAEEAVGRWVNIRMAMERRESV